MKRYLLIKICLLGCLVLFFFNYFVMPKDCEEPFRVVVRATTMNTGVRSLSLMENQDIRRSLSIDPSDYEEARYFKSADFMSADEFFMVKFKSHDDWDKFRISIENHVEKMEDIFKEYKPKEGRKIKKHSLIIKGNYGYYYVGDEASKIESQFYDVIGG